MMAVVHALDDYYLAITLLITIAYQLFFFSIAFSLKFDKLTDFAGGTNFVVLAIITLAFSGHHHARQIVCSLFIMLWGARLSGFLLFRIIKTGKDDRFDDKRDKFWSFLGFWVFQMIWVWIVSLPVTILNSPNVTKFNQPAFGTGRDIAGVILFAIGFILESVSDIQKYQFRSKPENKGKVCDIGFFTWTRHPNYFGEIIIQFAIFMIAVSPSAYGYVTGGAFSAQYAAILGSLLPYAPADVRVRVDPPRTTGGKEEVREREPLGVVLAIHETHEYPDPLSAAAVRTDAHYTQEDAVP
ncbi:hypothetical protein XPA_001118 [Xanthoria parietina]